MIIMVITGFISGIISGMGIGGGSILIPALTIFGNVNQHMAQGINLLYFIPTAISALYVHIKNKNIDFKMVLPLIASGVFAAAGGAFLATVISAKLLRKIFGVFLFVIGIYEILKKKRKN